VAPAPSRGGLYEAAAAGLVVLVCVFLGLLNGGVVVGAPLAAAALQQAVNQLGLALANGRVPVYVLLHRLLVVLCHRSLLSRPQLGRVWRPSTLARSDLYFLPSVPS
jgi:hypothetical protein